MNFTLNLKKIKLQCIYSRISVFFAILVIQNALAIILQPGPEIFILVIKVSVLESTHHFNVHQQMTCLSTTKCLADKAKEQTWH